MYLPKEVISSEFPNLELKSKDGKTVTLTFNNGENVVINKQNTNGTMDSEVYTFNSLENKSVWPDNPEFPDYLAKLRLESFDGTINSNFKDDYNDNTKGIEKTVNGLVDYAVNQRSFFSRLKVTFSDFKGFVETIISSKVAEYLSKFSDQFYKKEEINKLLEKQNTKIENIRRRLPNQTTIGTFHNPSRSDQMPTNLDVNDKVTPEAQSILDEIEKGGN